jgi:hypothetical protein
LNPNQPIKKLFEAEVEVSLRLTVSQSVHLVFESLPEAHGQILLIICNNFRFVLQNSLAFFYQQRHLAAKQEKYGDEMAIECCLQSISFTLVGFFNSDPTSKINITKINWLMLLEEIAAVYSGNHIKPINTKYSLRES